MKVIPITSHGKLFQDVLTEKKSVLMSLFEPKGHLAGVYSEICVAFFVGSVRGYGITQRDPLWHNRAQNIYTLRIYTGVQDKTSL